MSNRFDAEDIRKLREYNSLKHSKMSHKEILDDIRQGAESFMSEFSSCVADKRAVYDASEKMLLFEQFRYNANPLYKTTTNIKIVVVPLKNFQ